jgi:hypothetical protein
VKLITKLIAAAAIAAAPLVSHSMTYLEQMVADINYQLELPKVNTATNGTRSQMDPIRFRDGHLIFSERLIDYAEADLIKMGWSRQMDQNLIKRGFLKGFCGVKGASRILDIGFPLDVYVYSRDGTQIGAFDLKQGDCNAY